MAKKDTVLNPRAYMELAIEEMRKSTNDVRPDGKASPKVGVVILLPDGEVHASHRGELRSEEHAEYTLLERKLSKKNLKDSILFSTLEPCLERNHPKQGCSKHIAKSRIKMVYIGINDPDPTVDGKGVKYLQDHGIKVTMFDRDLQKIIKEENSAFLNQAIERKQKADKTEMFSPLEKADPLSSLDHLSQTALQKFLDLSKLTYNITSTDFYRFLNNIGVLSFNEKENIFQPTGMGILLFGNNPREKFHQASLKAEIKYGNNNNELIDFDQPLVMIPDLVEKWLKKVLPYKIDTSSFKREEVYDFPIPILREAIVNALVHRDYTIEGAKSYLIIDEDKIVVKSPGGPLPAITLEQLKKLEAPSISRNPILTYVFNLMGYVEEREKGMESFRSLLNNYDLPLPEFEFINPFLTLTFPRSLESVRQVSSIPDIQKLSSEELKGYEYIKQQGKVSRKQYQNHFHLGSDKKAERHLKKMVELGLIKRVGSGPSTAYESNPDINPDKVSG